MDAKAAGIGLICFGVIGHAAAADPQGRSGEQIVQAQCVRCHGTGVGGAPVIGDRAAWVPRMKLGLDAVVHSAIKGHGPMPPRGGMADLTDPEIRAAVTYMFNAGVALPAPAKVAAPASPDPHRKVVDGMRLDLGVVPAQAIRSRAGKGPESTMHGGIPSGDDYYHVSVTLREAGTDSSIRNAKVQARVASALDGESRTLEPMPFGATMSYGNYFRMLGRNPYRITVTVTRPGAGAVETQFEFRTGS